MDVDPRLDDDRLARVAAAAWLRRDAARDVAIDLLASCVFGFGPSACLVTLDWLRTLAWLIGRLKRSRNTPNISWPSLAHAGSCSSSPRTKRASLFVWRDARSRFGSSPGLWPTRTNGLPPRLLLEREPGCSARSTGCTPAGGEPSPNPGG